MLRTVMGNGLMEDYNELIRVDDWALDETYDGIFSKGAREKTVYLSPASPRLPFLRGSHLYLFKKSSHRYPWQFWMEIMAYRIGDVMGMPVPPAYVAVSEEEVPGKGPVYGALIEWFYDADQVYIDGGLIMSAQIPGFDRHKGMQHNLQTIFETRYLKETTGYWAQILTFDTIIGNVDRHQDNWGIILPKIKSGIIPKEQKIAVGMSPAFDNGTALNYEILEQNFDKFADSAYVNRYLTKPKRARHHMRWSLNEPEDINFYDFMARFLDKYPEARCYVDKALAFNRVDIQDRLHPLTQIDVPEEYRLTPRRLGFTMDMLMRRKELLEKAIALH